MYSTYSLREALKNGEIKGYTLFPEIRKQESLEKIKSKDITNKMLEELSAYTTEPNKVSPTINFSMFMEFEKSGKRLVYEDAYFTRRKQLFSLVLEYIIVKDEKLVNYIEEKLWEWCDLYTWELPAHIPLTVEAVEKNKIELNEFIGLFSAESAFFFTEILYIIGQELDQLLVHRLKSEIFRRVLNPYKLHTFWWEGARMNWSSVCAGSIGAAAIYLIEDSEELCVILQRVLCSMETFIEAFDKDGLITEGLSYWSYGFSFYVYFAQLLKERTAGELDLFKNNKKLIKIAQLPIFLQFPSEKFVTFSDSGSETWSGDIGLLTRLSMALNIKDYIFPQKESVFRNHTNKWAEMSRKLFWGMETDAEKSGAVRTGMKYFEESGWLVDRRGLRDGAFVAFAAKGGDNDEPHNHNDLGNFILHYEGSNIFVDCGSVEYVKQYFREETRYSFLIASSKGHSVPVINGNLQREGSEHHARVINCEEKASQVIFNLDLRRAYEESGMAEYHREFIWNYNNLELSINDSFRFYKAENEIEEIFITEVKPKFVMDGKIGYEFDNCITELLYEKEFQCSIKEESYKNHEGANSTLFRTCICAKNQASNTNLNFRINIIRK